MSKIYRYKVVERNHNIMIAEEIGNHQNKRYEVLERYSFYTMDSGKIKKVTSWKLLACCKNLNDIYSIYDRYINIKRNRIKIDLIF